MRAQNVHAQHNAKQFAVQQHWRRIIVKIQSIIVCVCACIGIDMTKCKKVFSINAFMKEKMKRAQVTVNGRNIYRIQQHQQQQYSAVIKYWKILSSTFALGWTKNLVTNRLWSLSDQRFPFKKANRRWFPEQFFYWLKIFGKSINSKNLCWFWTTRPIALIVLHTQMKSARK